MPHKVLKSLAMKAGISLKDAEKKWRQAEKEATALGQKNNYAYVMDIFKSLAGLDESSIKDTLKNLNAKFLSSGYDDFKQFQEDLVNNKLEETIMSVGFFGKTPSEEPIAIKKVGNPDKGPLKPDALDHVGEHEIGKTGQSEVEKNAKALGFDIISRINKNKDPRSPENTAQALSDLDSADAEPEIISETITSDSIGDTPENLLDVVVHPPSVKDQTDLKKKMKDAEDENEDAVEVVK